jgi:hypothetical protein
LAARFILRADVGTISTRCMGVGDASNDISLPKAHTGDPYRIKAAVLHAQAQSLASPNIKKQFDDLSLSEAYLRLAAQADRNATLDLVYEPPPAKLISK